MAVVARPRAPTARRAGARRPRATWVVPSQDLVIVRWGFEPPKQLGWDHSMVPNLLLADLLQRKR